jgi:hypothetical protein
MSISPNQPRLQESYVIDYDNNHIIMFRKERIPKKKKKGKKNNI